MDNDANYAELVKEAQLGGQESLNRLSELAKGRVSAYIYRLTLNHDVTQDLVQETLLEMVESLKKLEHVDRFWCWLLRTAMGKVQHYFRDQQQKRQREQILLLEQRHLSKLRSGDYGDGLKNLIGNELSEAIFEAMGKLKLRHRNVLVLRCFEQMPYSEIAALMDCSEIAAQVLFSRAKRSLKRQLSRHGFTKGMLLAGLSLFGRMTAPAEAASATINVTNVSTKVSLIAAVLGAAGTWSGAAIATAIIGAILSMGALAAFNARNATAFRSLSNNLGHRFNPSKVSFKYPYRVVDAYDPDGDGWIGGDKRGNWPVPVVLEEWLAGFPRSNLSSVALPSDHCVELKFRGKIVDGPGDDIVLIEWDTNGEQAGVFITDGAGNERPLGVAKAGTSGTHGPTEIGLDISGISLPFVPCAVRLLGMDEGGNLPGFDLGSVRARTYVGHSQLSEVNDD